MSGNPPSRLLFAVLLPLLSLLAGCGGGATLQPPGPGGESPQLDGSYVTAKDGYRLPLWHWAPAGDTPDALVLAVHGFNDHGGSFNVLAEALTEQNIEVYAFDQRGFGVTRQRRLWPGHQRMVDDIDLLARLLRERHPDTPLYLVGKSMGGALVMLTMSRDTPPPVDGSVLIAPAVWGQVAMPWYQRASLWLGIRLIPDVAFSARAAERLGIEPTDDEAIMAKLAKDPRILRSARVDTLYGVTRTMDLALDVTPQLTGPILLLYGDNDQVIPPEAMCALLERLPEDNHDAWRLALYPDGYHMLTRYTQRQRTEADIAAWLKAPSAPLPSDSEVSFSEARQTLC
ncbi:alpha/beta hydrolase [Halomonas sp. ML-15]|uniref:alpha/beta hydrolase n=1 Tax=Halomonas sp. ML-15 TaxID=2773305 RepID=UPI001746BD36|nr:alpha/beta hydrolase [Halomonas sp. ML-15]MBD3897613.1 alpha/beta hydrolase [Halomonas sp. ML-15]